jgi:hypothetical protein
MKNMWLWFCALMICPVLMSSGRAADVTCPQKVATIQNALVYKEVEHVFRQIYKQLGCELILLEMPAKRGIVSFNNHHIDGELLRTPAIEGRYSREFVRSVPLVVIRFGLWALQDKVERIGYLQGFVVHQDAANKYVQQGRVVQSFASNEQMFAALQRGALDAVITGELAWKAYSTRHPDAPRVGLREILAHLELHHYLSVDYTLFMREFSQYVQQNKPFGILGAIN